MAKLDEVLCPNNRILGLMKRIQQALSPRGVTSTTSDDQGEVILSTDTENILERWDEVVLQLKRTHLHLFLISGFDGIEDDPTLILKPKRHRLLAAAVEDDDLADLLHVREEQAANTASGTFTQDVWQTRVLNTVVTNEISGASLATNQITLPAGTYEIRSFAPAYRCSQHQSKLRDTTNTSDLIIGSSAFTDTSVDGDNTHTFVNGKFTLSGEVVLELQHRCTVSHSTNGFGVAGNVGVVEVYAEVLIKKLA